MFKLFIDADSIPLKHREIILRRAIKEGVETFFVADRPLKDVLDAISLDTEHLRQPFRAELDKAELKRIKSKISMVVVSQGQDSADNEIYSRVEAPALCITHDIPLSARLIEKGAWVLDDRGNILSRENINERLSIRSINADFREMGLSSDRTKAFDQRTINRFNNALDSSIAALKREIGKK